MEKILLEFGLDLMNCRGRSYDGAENMAGKVNDISGTKLKNNSRALHSVIDTGQILLSAP